MQEIESRVAVGTLAVTLLCSVALRSAATSAQEPDGAKIYAATCASCHQPSGLGLAEKSYPPLVGSEWVLGNEERMVLIMLHGLTGEVEVQGETFSGQMPTWGPTFQDGDISAVATYVRRSWGNHVSPVATETVTRLRTQFADRKTPWTVPELRKAVPDRR